MKVKLIWNKWLTEDLDCGMVYNVVFEMLRRKTEHRMCGRPSSYFYSEVLGNLNRYCSTRYFEDIYVPVANFGCMNELSNSIPTEPLTLRFKFKTTRNNNVYYELQ